MYITRETGSLDAPSLLGYNNTSPISHDIYIMTRSVESSGSGKRSSLGPGVSQPPSSPPPSSFLPKCFAALVRHPVQRGFLTGTLHPRHSSHVDPFRFFFPLLSLSFSFPLPLSLCLISIALLKRARCDAPSPLPYPGQVRESAEQERHVIRSAETKLVNPFQTLRLFGRFTRFALNTILG